MKTASHQVAAVLGNPARFTGILFYGDDLGRMRDGVRTATRSVIGEASDPFRFSALTREEHGRLREEVGSRALGGGRRVVRVQDAADGLAQHLDGLSIHREDTLVLLEAGALTPRSKLRLAAEKLPDWAVIACYAEAGAAVAGEIRQVLGASGLGVEANTLAFLTQELAGDSLRRRGELEKLSLFAAGHTTVTFEDAQACCAASLDATLSSAISAAFSGHVARCDALLEELAQDGASGPGVLAVLAGQVQRLLKLRLLLDSGRSAEEACRSLQPPVYPRQMATLLREVERWSTPRLEALGRAVRDADLACKRAGSPDMAIAGRLLGLVASTGSARS